MAQIYNDYTAVEKRKVPEEDGEEPSQNPADDNGSMEHASPDRPDEPLNYRKKLLRGEISPVKY